MKIEGKTFIITGGSSGLGAGTAKVLLSRRAMLFLSIFKHPKIQNLQTLQKYYLLKLTLFLMNQFKIVSKKL